MLMSARLVWMIATSTHSARTLLDRTTALVTKVTKEMDALVLILMNVLLELIIVTAMLHVGTLKVLLTVRVIMDLQEMALIA